MRGKLQCNHEIAIALDLLSCVFGIKSAFVEYRPEFDPDDRILIASLPERCP